MKGLCENQRYQPYLSNDVPAFSLSLAIGKQVQFKVTPVKSNILVCVFMSLETTYKTPVNGSV